MHYSLIRPIDIANGPGVRVSLFVSGCENKCKGCFQPETWDPNYGKEFKEETLAYILELLSPSHIQGLTILGGDPFFPGNVETVFKILNIVKKCYPIWDTNAKDIWVYTGYTLESLLQRDINFFNGIRTTVDWLVDGPFIESRKNISLQFRGSSNQRLIDIKQTIFNSTMKNINIYHKNKLSDKEYMIKKYVLL